MGVKGISCLVLGLVLMLTSAASCEAPELTAIELVPQAANLIANIEVGQIINDPDFRDAYNKSMKEPGQPQTVEEGLNEIIRETGVDLRDFSRAIVFGDIATLDQDNYFAVIVEGTFNEPQFIGNIEQKAGEEFVTISYKGYELYTDEEEEFAIAFLTDRMILLGTTKAVEDAIDVSKGDREQVSGTILDTYNRLGDALIKFAFECPEEARRSIREEALPSEIPISLEPFADIDMIGFALNKTADTVTAQIDSHFLSVDAAVDAKDTLSGAISLLKGMLEVPEIKELLGKVQVSVTDSWLTIAFEITLSEIEGLRETFQP